MKTVTFTETGSGYSCSLKGGQEGEYVRAEVAAVLLAACREAYEHCADHGHAEIVVTLRGALKQAEDAR